MKKTLVIILAIVMILGVVIGAFLPIIARAKVEAESPMAYPSLEQVKVDDKLLDMKIYTINGENFIKIRDLAAALKGTKAEFKLDFDGEKKAVILETGGHYEPLETDLKPAEEGKREALPQAQSLILDGKELSLESYLVEDNNYYRARDLGKALGFGVAYHEVEGVLMVSSKEADLKDVRVEVPEGEEILLVYGRSSCPYCLSAHDWLKEKEIKFISKDTGNDPEALRVRNDLRDNHGCKYIPTFVYGDKITYGFDEKVQEEILSWFEDK